MSKRYAVLTGLLIILVMSGTAVYQYSRIPSPPPDCDVFYYGNDGGIWGKNLASGQTGRILKPDGRWLWQKRLEDKYSEKWQILSSSAFYDELTPCRATGKIYVASVWSKDGGDANAAVIIEVGTDGTGMRVIAEHVAPYPPADLFFSLSPNGRFVSYYDDKDRLWKYDTITRTGSLIPSKNPSQAW